MPQPPLTRQQYDAKVHTARARSANKIVKPLLPPKKFAIVRVALHSNCQLHACQGRDHAGLLNALCTELRIWKYVVLVSTIGNSILGKLPFHGEYNGEMIRDWIQAGEKPWEPTEEERAADDCLWDIIAKCIKTDVKQRLSLREVQLQLEIEHARVGVPSAKTPSWTLQNDRPSDDSTRNPKELSRSVQDTLSQSSSISRPLLGSQFLLTELGEFSTPALKFWQTWCLDDSTMTWNNFFHGIFLELGALGNNNIDTELLKTVLETPAGGSQGPSLPAFKTFVQANSVKGFPAMFLFAVIE
ncbi:hypothetical protein HDU84_001747, partial [Entophlyctis sp. JEL0112]